ncbi:ASCH domain-containing protein [Candidatus Babeliales bacterium]|nr:ASCH domain-containing protein [Candidatus Babeliales bacterium]
MKALSVKQPHAWLIVNGFKSIENRTWHTKRTGTILIHAGLKRDTHADMHQIRKLMNNDKEYARLIYDLDKPESFGGIVGQADIVDCVDYHDSPWFTGPVGFVLGNQKTLPFLPVKGRLSFFEVKTTEDQK